jgi:plastocyanin
MDWRGCAATKIRAGPDTQELTVEGGLPAGEYFFRCDVHPTIMTGTLIVE